MANVREYLQKYIGKNRNLVKSSNGTLVTKEEKQKQDIQIAQEKKRQLEAQEKKANIGIREALALINNSSSTQNNSNTYNERPKRATTPKTTPHSNTTSRATNNYYNIDVPLIQKNPRTPESDALDAYAQEAAAILNSTSPRCSTNKSKSTSNAKQKSSQSPDFDKDDR